MALKERIDQHDKEIAEIRAAQLRSSENLARLEQAMIALVNQQADTKRAVEDLSRTVDRFIRSLKGPNGHTKR